MVRRNLIHETHFKIKIIEIKIHMESFCFILFFDIYRSNKGL